MDDYKRQCRDRFRGRGRYKNHSKVVAKQEPHASKRKEEAVPNNWSRYDDFDSDTNILVLSENPSQEFKLMSDGPVSIGSYFTFKSDKILEDTKVELDEMFQLDTGLIGMALGTIPFYERVGIDPKILSDEEIKEMDRVAGEKSEIYLRKRFEEVHIEDDDPSITIIKPPSSQSSSGTVETSPATQKDVVTEELPVAAAAQRDLVTEELEEWLEDVLN